VTRHGLNVAKIPAEDRLLRCVSVLRTNIAIAKQCAELAREEQQPLPSPQATLPGDPWRLRGIPAVGGRGTAGGAIRGSLPHVAGLVDRPTMHALAVLVRDDGNGVSPGSDPEAETMRLFEEAEARRAASTVP
jgi:hypothetical protein